MGETLQAMLATYSPTLDNSVDRAAAASPYSKVSNPPTVPGSPPARWKVELESLVGLASVKAEVESLRCLAQTNQTRSNHCMACWPMAMHYIFTGSPGTGKTTVARIFGQMLREYGILNNGHVHEVTRATLVGQYIGKTAPAIINECKKALDGVLFIDEAYALTQSGSDMDYGHEAIAELLKFMEDNRGRIVVIAAGYREYMQGFVQSNPGLASRFTATIHFDDLSPSDLLTVFETLAGEHDYVLTSSAHLRLASLLHYVHSKREPHFGNARFVRNLFEETIKRHAFRLQSARAELNRDNLIRIEANDIPDIPVADSKQL